VPSCGSRALPEYQIIILGVISEFATEFENLLMKCHRLRKIFIQGLTTANIFNLSLLFDILVEIAPDSLHEIRMCIGITFQRMIWKPFSKIGEEEGVLKRYDVLEDYGDFIELLQN
ncbi:3335_t:CDS:2, partial [Funneliformis mosseae]